LRITETAPFAYDFEENGHFERTVDVMVVVQIYPVPAKVRREKSKKATRMHWVTGNEQSVDMLPHGWSNTILKPGMKITIALIPARMAARRGIRQVTLGDGTIMKATTRNFFRRKTQGRRASRSRGSSKIGGMRVPHVGLPIRIRGGNFRNVKTNRWFGPFLADHSIDALDVSCSLDGLRLYRLKLSNPPTAV